MSHIAERLKQISREHAQEYGRHYVMGGKYVDASRKKSNLGGTFKKLVFSGKNPRLVGGKRKKVGPKEKAFKAYAKKIKAEVKKLGGKAPTLAILRSAFNKRYKAGCMDC